MKARKATARKTRKEPQVLYRGGRPTAVLLDIKEYRRLLEIAEDQEDLDRLAELDRRPQPYRPFEDFLDEWGGR